MSVAGELGDFDVMGILNLLARRRASGRLRLTAGGDDVCLYLDAGKLALVTSTRLPLRLGRMIRQRALINDRQLHEALRVQEAEGGVRSLGEILVSKGWVQPAQIAACAHEQAVSVLARVLTAGEGAFVWTSGIAAPARGPSVPVDAQRALVEAMQRVDHLSKLRAQLPSPHAPLAVSARVDVTIAPYNDVERRIVIALQAGVRSWGELVDLLPVEESKLLHVLIDLRRRGLVVAGEGAPGADIGVAGGGPPSSSDLSRILGRRS